MRGRPPIDPEIHKLQGTFEPSRHRGRGCPAIAEGDLTLTPPGLSPAQRLIWRYTLANAPRHLLKKIDRDMLLLWVTFRDRHERARQHLALLEGQPLLWAQSPQHRVLDRTAATLLRLASELGFTPAARRGLSITPPPQPADPDDPWAMLRLIPGGKDPAEPALRS